MLIVVTLLLLNGESVNGVECIGSVCGDEGVGLVIVEG